MSAILALLALWISGAVLGQLAGEVFVRLMPRRRSPRIHRQLLTTHCYHALDRLNAGDPSAVRLSWTHNHNGTRGMHPFRFVVMELPHGVDPHVDGPHRLKFLALGIGDFA